MQAVQRGDGEAYAQTILFKDDEELQTRPLFVDSIRLQFNLRTNLVQRFGGADFLQSQFPAFLDVLDTSRIQEATESIQGNRGTLVLPWGSRLPFVKERGDWKLDYFALPGINSPARYRLRAAQRNSAIRTVTTHIQTRSYADMKQAYNALQQELK